MKTEDVTYFICEVCGYKSTSKETVEKCEKRHRSPKRIAGFYYSSEYPDSPEFVVLEFERDSKALYKRCEQRIPDTLQNNLHEKFNVIDKIRQRN